MPDVQYATPSCIPELFYSVVQFWCVLKMYCYSLNALLYQRLCLPYYFFVFHILYFIIFSHNQKFLIFNFHIPQFITEIISITVLGLKEVGMIIQIKATFEQIVFFDCEFVFRAKFGKDCMIFPENWIYWTHTWIDTSPHSVIEITPALIVAEFFVGPATQWRSTV